MGESVVNRSLRTTFSNAPLWIDQLERLARDAFLNTLQKSTLVKSLQQVDEVEIDHILNCLKDLINSKMDNSQIERMVMAFSSISYADREKVLHHITGLLPYFTDHSYFSFLVEILAKIVKNQKEEALSFVESFLKKGIQNFQIIQVLRGLEALADEQRNAIMFAVLQFFQEPIIHENFPVLGIIQGTQEIPNEQIEEILQTIKPIIRCGMNTFHVVEIFKTVLWVDQAQRENVVRYMCAVMRPNQLNFYEWSVLDLIVEIAKIPFKERGAFMQQMLSLITENQSNAQIVLIIQQLIQVGQEQREDVVKNVRLLYPACHNSECHRSSLIRLVNSLPPEQRKDIIEATIQNLLIPISYGTLTILIEHNKTAQSFWR